MSCTKAADGCLQLNDTPRFVIEAEICASVKRTGAMRKPRIVL